jgi:penicillin-insensitive murein endopeptidase
MILASPSATPTYPLTKYLPDPKFEHYLHMHRLFTLLILTLSITAYAQESTCYGTTSNGRLEGGVRLPSAGNNFISYSTTAEMLGRTYIHSKVRDIIIDSYKSLETEAPNKVFKYAETGFKEGGKFRPHKTHRNGLSVDFMVPVLNKEGLSVHLPTNYFNKLGYNIEFDKNGRYKEYSIDFRALAAHIVTLHKSAKKHDANIWRVIFDPMLQPKLFQTEYGPYLKKHVQFSNTRSWVRHDEHYHVDFDIKCKSNQR